MNAFLVVDTLSDQSVWNAVALEAKDQPHDPTNGSTRAHALLPGPLASCTSQCTTPSPGHGAPSFPRYLNPPLAPPVPPPALSPRDAVAGAGVRYALRPYLRKAPSSTAAKRLGTAQRQFHFRQSGNTGLAARSDRTRVPGGYRPSPTAAGTGRPEIRARIFSPFLARKRNVRSVRHTDGRSHPLHRDST